MISRPVSLLSFLFSAVVNLSASEGIYQALTTEGIELAYNLHFEEANKIFNRLIELEPQNPRGYLLQSVSFYYRYQLEENHKSLGKAFQRHARQAIESAKSYAATNSNKLDALFYLGTAHIYLAAYHGWESQWLKAYWYGKEGISYLERLVELDSTYYDAYLGLGLYHYYTDVLPQMAKAVTFILGVDNNREKGLHELEIAATRGTYSKAEALLFLGSIYLYIEKDYHKALEYHEELVWLFPENDSFMMLLGENYQKLNRNAEAIRALSHVVDDAKGPEYPALRIGSYFRLGNLYFNMRRLPRAITFYQKSLSEAEQSTGNVRWVFALANLNIGRSYDMLGRRREALFYYGRVKRADHQHAHKIAQLRTKTPLSRHRRPARNQVNSEIIDMYQPARDSLRTQRH